jgi:hypothetical protein
VRAGHRFSLAGNRNTSCLLAGADGLMGAVGGGKKQNKNFKLETFFLLLLLVIGVSGYIVLKCWLSDKFYLFKPTAARDEKL